MQEILDRAIDIIKEGLPLPQETNNPLVGMNEYQGNNPDIAPQ